MMFLESGMNNFHSISLLQIWSIVFRLDYLKYK